MGTNNGVSKTSGGAGGSESFNSHDAIRSKGFCYSGKKK